MTSALKRSALAGTAAAALGTILGVAGCDAPAELRAVVDEARPRNATRVGSCHSSGSLTSFDDYPTYGCTFFAPGSRRAVAASIVTSLGSQGFELRCGEERFSETVEIWGTRAQLRSLASISKLGSTIDLASNGEPLGINRPRSTPSGDYRTPPAGHVIVRLDASDREDMQELPENPERDRCGRLLKSLSE